MRRPFSSTLTALNRNAKDYTDLTQDGRVGPLTLHALDAFLETRGKKGGETVLMRALEALQGERYLRLAEPHPANEAFRYGWLANRIGTICRSLDTVNLVNLHLERTLRCQFWKPSSGQSRSCSTRSFSIRRRGTGQSSSC